MPEYISTFSEKLRPDVITGIVSLPVVIPTGDGWTLQSQGFVEETNQFSWIWKRDESAGAIYIDQLQADYETLSVDRPNEVEVDDDEETILAVRPKAGGLIFPIAFAAMQTDSKYVKIRFYIGDAPSGGTWTSRGNYSQINISPNATPPATKTHIGTIYIDTSKRSDYRKIDSSMFLTSTSQAIFVTAETVSSKADVLASITWGEKSA